MRLPVFSKLNPANGNNIEKRTRVHVLLLGFIKDISDSVLHKVETELIFTRTRLTSGNGRFFYFLNLTSNNQRESINQWLLN